MYECGVKITVVMFGNYYFMYFVLVSLPVCSRRYQYGF